MAVLIDQAQDYCVGLAKFFTEEFKRRGGQIVSTSYIQTGDQDFSAQISALKGNNPDLIYAPNYYSRRWRCWPSSSRTWGSKPRS